VVAEHAEAAPIEPVAPSQATTPQAPVEAEAVANLFEALPADAAEDVAPAPAITAEVVATPAIAEIVAPLPAAANAAGASPVVADAVSRAEQLRGLFDNARPEPAHAPLPPADDAAAETSRNA
jgi:hypothetical protein